MFGSLAEFRRANVAAGGHFFDPGHAPTDRRIQLLFGRFVLVHKRDTDGAGEVHNHFCLYRANDDGTVRPVDRVESWQEGVDLARDKAGQE